MDKSPLLCLIVCIGLNMWQVLCQPSDSEAKLRSDLFQSYPFRVKPRNTTNVRLRMTMGSFDFLDESLEMMSAHVWLLQIWTDSRLTWDPIQYNGTSKLAVRADQIWLPDIELYNGISTVETMGSNHVDLTNEGLLYVFSSLQHNFICRMNLLYFPYDKQQCTLRYGSWAFNEKQLNLISLDVTGLEPDFPEDFILTEVAGSRISLKYECCPEPFVEIHYTFKLERYSRAYTAKLVIPSVLAGILILATFLVPNGERIAFCGFLFLTFVLLLIYLQSLVPVSGDTIIGEYIAFAIFVNFFATVIAVASYNINEWLKSKPGGGMIDAEGKDHIPKLPMGITITWLKYLDISSFLLFTLVYVIGVAVILGRRG